MLQNKIKTILVKKIDAPDFTNQLTTIDIDFDFDFAKKKDTGTGHMLLKKTATNHAKKT